MIAYHEEVIQRVLAYLLDQGEKTSHLLALELQQKGRSVTVQEGPEIKPAESSSVW